MAEHSKKQASRISMGSAKQSRSSSKSSVPIPVNLPPFNFKRSASGVTKEQWRVSWKAARKQSPWLKLLKPAQKRGVRAANSTDGFAALFAQRSGKTWVTGALLLVEKPRDVLIVGLKTNLKSTWSKFLEEKLGVYTVCLSLKAFKECEDSHRILLLHYQAVPAIVNDLCKIKWDCTIYDEAQGLKNRTSIASKNAYKLGRVSKKRIALTGTPMDLDEKDLWAIMRFVKPELFGTSYPQWEKEYCAEVKIDPGKAKGMFARKRMIMAQRIAKKKAGLHDDGKIKFARRMAKHAMRISREDAGLIPANIHIIPVKLHKKQESLYRDMEANMLFKHKGVVVKAPLKIVQIGKLQQITGGHIKDEDGEVHKVGNSKMLKFIDAVFEHAPDDRFVVFCKYVWEVHAVAEALKEQGWHTVAKLWGAIKDVKNDPVRTQMLLEWQTGRYDVIVCQQQTGGVGVDLYTARKAFVYSMGHSFIKYDQMISRLDFLDATDAADIFLLLADNSIDTDIYTGVSRKMSITNLFYDRMNGKTTGRT